MMVSWFETKKKPRANNLKTEQRRSEYQRRLKICIAHKDVCHNCTRDKACPAYISQMSHANDMLER